MVQIMMAAGMMGLLSLGLMKLMENQRLSAKSLKSSAAAQNFYNEAKAYLGRPGYCSKNFEGVRVKEGDEFELENILKANGDTLYIAGKIYEQGLLRLESISTKNFERDSESTGLMQLVFKLAKVGKSYGAKAFVRIVKLSLSLDEDGKILNCGPLGSSGGFSFEGSEKAMDAEKGISELQDGVESEDAKNVGNIIEKNPSLKQMNEALKNLKETNKQMEEMFKE